MEERLQKLGQAIARALWLKHRSAGPCRPVVCLAELALDIVEQDESPHGLLRATNVSLEQLRADASPSIYVH